MSNYRIGYLACDRSSPYTARLFSSVKARAQQLGLEVIVYIGSFYRDPTAHRGGFNEVYKYINPSTVDGLITATSTLSIFADNDYVTKQFAQYGCPLVSIGEEVAGASAVLFDNLSGMHDIVDHLIVHHHYRRIAFIRGPKGSRDADQRFTAYCQSLQKHGIDLDPDLVFEGLFLPESGQQAMERILANNIQCDAIVAANDDMVVTAMSYAESRGVAKQYAFTGFDDYYPWLGLTSVAQPIEEIGAVAVDQLYAMLEGNAPTRLTERKGKIMLRGSCGCAYEQYRLERDQIDIPILLTPTLNREEDDVAIAEDIIAQCPPLLRNQQATAFIAQFEKLCRHVFQALPGSRLANLSSQFVDGRPNYLNAVLFKLHSEIENEIIQTGDIGALQQLNATVKEALLRVGMLTARATLEEGSRQFTQARSVEETLHSITFSGELGHIIGSLTKAVNALDVKDFYMVVFDEPCGLGEGVALPNSAKVIYAYSDDAVESPIIGTRVTPTQLLPETQLHHISQRCAVILPLFQGNLQFGYLIVSADSPSPSSAESVRSYISQVFTQTGFAEAINSNAIMGEIAFQDDLTGLTNRRGFLDAAQEAFEQAPGNYHLFFIDMNNLKPINDNRGHQAGDQALRAMASSMRKSLPENAVIARYGGDEFVALCTEESGPSELLAAEIKLALRKLDRGKFSPHRLGCAIGHKTVTPADYAKLQDVLAEADLDMYEKKRRDRT